MSPWLYYPLATLRVSLILAFPVGVVFGVARGWSYLVHGFFAAFLGQLGHALGTAAVVVLALMTVALVVFGVVRRARGSARLAAFAATAVCCFPFFALWAYRVNAIHRLGSVTWKSVSWNLVMGTLGLLIWIVLATALLAWTRSTASRRAPIFTTAFTTLSVVFTIAIPFPWVVSTVSPARPPNVIVLLVDALRQDRLGCYGYSRNTTPNIDEFAKDSVVFTQAVSHSTFTKICVSSLFTSLYPYQHGVYWGQKEDEHGRRMSHSLSDDETTLAEALLEGGFVTMACAKNQHLQASYGFGQGFVEYNDREGSLERVFAPPSSLSGRWPNIDDINGYFLRWYRWTGRHGRFFAYLHYMDQHGPNHPAPPYDEMYGVYSDVYAGVDFDRWGSFLEDVRTGRRTLEADDVAQLEAYYDGQLNYVDAEIGRFLAQLKRLGIYDDSLIVLTSDHGDGFMEHGFLAHSTTPYDELMRVPLIVKFPGSRHRRTVDEQVRHIDLMPTILDYVGATSPGHMEGVSLMGVVEGDASDGTSGLPPYAISEIGERDDAYPAIAIRTVTRKYIHFQNRPDELYDLTTDPGERNNIAELRPQEVEEFRAMALEIVAKRRLEGLDTQELSEEAIEELRTLGYVE